LVVESWLKRKLEKQGYTFDSEMDNKSVTKPTLLFDALLKYFRPRAFQPDAKALNTAIATALKTFGGNQQLKPFPLDDTLSEAVQLNKSSGAPEFVKKGEAFLKDLSRAKRILEGQVRFPFCLPFRRGQHGPDGPKTRLVWGYPLAMTLLEARFARPVIDWFLKVRIPPLAFGQTNAGVGAQTTRISNSGVRVSLDFSGFDATVPVQLIEAAFSILSTHFDRWSDEERRCWSVVRHYFTNTPIAMPDGCMYVKRRGVPSGSYFTQLIDSIVNFIAVQYAHLRMYNCTIHPSKVLVLGDDCVFGATDHPDMEAFARSLTELGLRINLQKTVVSRFGDPLPFLGHEWICGLKHRDVHELAIRAVHPERHASQTKVVAGDRLLSIGSSSVGGVSLLMDVNRSDFGPLAIPIEALLLLRWTPVVATGFDELRESLDPGFVSGIAEWRNNLLITGILR
jgi:hypothetical protein